MGVNMVPAMSVPVTVAVMAVTMAVLTAGRSRGHSGSTERDSGDDGE